MFNKSRKWDFAPEIKFSDGTMMEPISETRQLGLITSDYIKWEKNTHFICTKAKQKLWMLRRMDEFKIFDAYSKEVRSLLELAVPVWHPGLTVKQSDEIE